MWRLIGHSPGWMVAVVHRPSAVFYSESRNFAFKGIVIVISGEIILSVKIAVTVALPICHTEENLSWKAMEFMFLCTDWIKLWFFSIITNIVRFLKHPHIYIHGMVCLIHTWHLNALIEPQRKTLGRALCTTKSCTEDRFFSDRTAFSSGRYDPPP